MNDEKFNYQILEEKINKLTLQNTLIISELDLIKKALINNYNYKENKNFCPICGEFSVFEDYGEITRKNVRCPNCGQ